MNEIKHSVKNDRFAYLLIQSVIEFDRTYTNKINFSMSVYDQLICSMNCSVARVEL